MVDDMSVDWMMMDAGIVKVETSPAGLEEALYPSCLEFLRANGRLTWSEWKSLSGVSRRAFAAAGDAIRKRQALDHAFASRSDDSYEALYEGWDHEEHKARMTLRAITDAISKKYS